MDRTIAQTFRIHGITLKAEALTLLKSHLSNFSDADTKSFIKDVLSKIERTQRQLDHVYLSQLISLVTKNDVEDTDPILYFHCIDAPETPHFQYNSSLKSFESVPRCVTFPVVVSRARKAKGSFFGEATQKTQMYQNRYQLLKQRILNHPDLADLSVVNEQMVQGLTTVESLVGAKGPRMVLGFLSQLREGEYFLEDHNNQIKLDFSELSQENLGSGLFFEGCIVVVSGVVTETAEFKVLGLHHPPAEAQQRTNRTFPGIDFFGGSPSLSLVPVIQQWEAQNNDCSMYILSDVWLDKPNVLTHLELLLFRLHDSGMTPNIFILIGNFHSQEFGQHPEDMETRKNHFKTLANILSKYEAIAQTCQFVFVPGPIDSSIPVYPFPALPSFYRAPLTEKLKNVTFTTNPCRLRVGMKTLVIYRDDLVNPLAKNCVIPPKPTESTGFHEHLAYTLVSQGHLNPSIDKPIQWNFDHSMYLYPLPDAVVLADQYEGYSADVEGCLCLNPGSFNIDTSFIEYCPISNNVEILQVDES